jgi:catechol 2,3-dioxygenase-like lactoylglutathione lyase family enzyme
MSAVLLGIHHVAICTPNADRLIDFYRGLLGFEVAADQSWEPGVEVADVVLGLRRSGGRQVLLKTGDGYLELFQFASHPGRPGDPDRPVSDHGYTHVCVDVDDVDDVFGRLSGAGVRFVSPPQDLLPGVRTCYARDPDGNIVEIQQLAAAHPFAVS